MYEGTERVKEKQRRSACKIMTARGAEGLQPFEKAVSGYLKWSLIMPFTHASFDTFCRLREWLNQYLQWISALGLLYALPATGSATFKSQLIELCHFTRST